MHLIQVDANTTVDLENPFDRSNNAESMVVWHPLFNKIEPVLRDMLNQYKLAMQNYVAVLTEGSDDSRSSLYRHSRDEVGDWLNCQFDKLLNEVWIDHLEVPSEVVDGNPEWQSDDLSITIKRAIDAEGES